jgi:hypothetical protein
MMNDTLTNFYKPLAQYQILTTSDVAIALVPLEICEEKEAKEIKEIPVLSSEQSCEMFLAMARNSKQPQIMENALGQALRLTRAGAAATLSSTMPTALKIKTCEIPVLKILLEFGRISAQWRAVVVLMLSVNIDCGSGHLSVNRAKQVLKELSKSCGINELSTELTAPDAERRLAAIIMLGWLKHEKAIEPLIDAFDRLEQREQAEILAVLDSHYKAKLAYFVRWRHANPQSISPRIMQMAV